MPWTCMFPEKKGSESLLLLAHDLILYCMQLWVLCQHVNLSPMKFGVSLQRNSLGSKLVHFANTFLVLRDIIQTAIMYYQLDHWHE